MPWFILKVLIISYRKIGFGWKKKNKETFITDFQKPNNKQSKKVLSKWLLFTLGDYLLKKKFDKFFILAFLYYVYNDIFIKLDHLTGEGAKRAKLYWRFFFLKYMGKYFRMFVSIFCISTSSIKIEFRLKFNFQFSFSIIPSSFNIK